jgi:hypothetical protein
MKPGQVDLGVRLLWRCGGEAAGSHESEKACAAWRLSFRLLLARMV